MKLAALEVEEGIYKCYVKMEYDKSSLNWFSVDVNLVHKVGRSER